MFIVQYLYQGQWQSSRQAYLTQGNAIKELCRLSRYHIARIIDERGNAIHLESVRYGPLFTRWKGK